MTVIMTKYLIIFSLFFIVHCTHSAAYSGAGSSSPKERIKDKAILFLSCFLDLTCEDVRAFVDGHNSRRYKLTKGEIEGQPPASDMLAMVWDQELAKKAAQWASTYTFDHNPDRSLASDRFTVGENIFKSSSPNTNYRIKIDDAVASWFSENSNFTFAPLSNENFGPGLPPIGHYTQMVWANSIYIGCAISYELEEEFKSYYVVCNYGPSGNYDGQTPYTPGNEGESYPFLCKTYPECKHPYGQMCIFD